MTASSSVIVTGGAGFIGSNLVDRLVGAGHSVTVVDDLSHGLERNLDAARAAGDVTLRVMDVRDPNLSRVLEEVRPSLVMHLAAQIDVRLSVADPRLDADVNILGTLNLLEAARAAGVPRVVVVSSGGAMYGDDAPRPTSEDVPAQPASPYGISKKVLSEYLRFYRDVHGISSAVCALANVYGPRQGTFGEAGVVAVFLRAMLGGESTTIFGDGMQTRDFVYVDDVCSALLAAATSGEGLYNIGTSRETSVSDLWHECARATNVEGRPEYAPERVGEIRNSSLDASRARRELGWEPKVGLSEGITRTADWMKTHLERARD